MPARPEAFCFSFALCWSRRASSFRIEARFLVCNLTVLRDSVGGEAVRFSYVLPLPWLQQMWSCMCIFNVPFCQLIDVFPNIDNSQRWHLPETKWDTQLPSPVPELSGGGVRRGSCNSSPRIPICLISKQTSSKNLSHVHFFFFFFFYTFYWSS